MDEFVDSHPLTVGLPRKRITLYRIGDSSLRNGVETAVPETFDQLLDVSTSRLLLRSRALRVFTQEGVRIRHIEEVKDGMSLIVSAGEYSVKPKEDGSFEVSFSESPRRQKSPYSPQTSPKASPKTSPKSVASDERTPASSSPSSSPIVTRDDASSPQDSHSKRDDQPHDWRLRVSDSTRKEEPHHRGSELRDSRVTFDPMTPYHEESGIQETPIPHVLDESSTSPQSDEIWADRESRLQMSRRREGGGGLRTQRVRQIELQLARELERTARLERQLSQLEYEMREAREKEHVTGSGPRPSTVRRSAMKPSAQEERRRRRWDDGPTVKEPSDVARGGSKRKDRKKKSSKKRVEREAEEEDSDVSKDFEDEDEDSDIDDDDDDEKEEEEKEDVENVEKDAEGEERDAEKSRDGAGVSWVIDMSPSEGGETHSSKKPKSRTKTSGKKQQTAIQSKSKVKERTGKRTKSEKKKRSEGKVSSSKPDEHGSPDGPPASMLSPQPTVSAVVTPASVRAAGVRYNKLTRKQRDMLTKMREIVKSDGNVSSGEILEHLLTDIWENADAESRKYLERFVNMEENAKSVYYESVMQQMFRQRICSDMNEEELAFVDVLRDKVSEYCAHNFHQVGGRKLQRVNVAIFGPRRSGKSTLCHLFVHHVLDKMMETGQWKRTFVVPISWSYFLQREVNIEAIYTKFCRHLVELLCLQKPSLVPHRPSLLLFLRKLIRHQGPPHLSAELMGRYEASCALLRTMGQRLQAAWFDLSQMELFMSIMCDLPKILAEAFDFHDVMFVYDHLDATNIRVARNTYGTEHQPLSLLSDYVVNSISSSQAIVSCVEADEFMKCFMGTREKEFILESMEAFETVNIVANDILFEHYPFLPRELQITDGQGKIVNVGPEVFRGCPAFLSRFVHMHEHAAQEERETARVVSFSSPATQESKEGTPSLRRQSSQLSRDRSPLHGPGSLPPSSSRPPVSMAPLLVRQSTMASILPEVMQSMHTRKQR
eukprot:TRINITY_DN3_c0_g2_i1.p1 TRINITY_DN3_c0_g2~~TRINITY_DN3_c0_g2_i1.p1  ORF type:complete len:998 (+),score=334.61 TRINITY_DN3_c0_g2_i1:106-3099(+)